MANIDQVKESVGIKFTSDEIEKVESFKSEFSELTARLGEIEIEMIIIENKKAQIEHYKETLKAKYIELRENEVKLANELKEKYGEGEFDTTSGIFTPKQ